MFYMGQVSTRIKVSNWLDLEKVALGERREPARAMEAEALVDTGAVRCLSPVIAGETTWLASLSGPWLT